MMMNDWMPSEPELDLGMALVHDQEPLPDMDGRWRVLVDDEPYRESGNRILLIDGEAVTDVGRRMDGTLRVVGDRKIISFENPANEDGQVLHERIVIGGGPKMAGNALSGMLYWGFAAMPENPRELFERMKALTDAGEYDEELEENLPIADIVYLYPEESAPADNDA